MSVVDLKRGSAPRSGGHGQTGRGLWLGRALAAFSLGEHHCPGASLSRFEQNCAWEILMQRVRNMRPVPHRNDYDHVQGMWLRALKET